MDKIKLITKIKKLLTYKKQTADSIDFGYISIIQCHSKNGEYFKTDLEALNAVKHIIDCCDFKENDFKIIRFYGKFVQEKCGHILDTR